MNNFFRKYAELLLFLGVVAAAFFLRWQYLWHQVGIPTTVDWGGDPTHHYNIAHNIAQGRGPVTNFIFAFWFLHPGFPAMTDIYPPGFHSLAALFIKLFGASPLSVRLASFFCSIMLLPLIFLFTRRLSKPAAWIALVFTALNMQHIEYSSVIMTVATTALLFFLAIYSATLAQRSQKIWAYFLSGLILGWGILTHGLMQSVVLATFLISAYFFIISEKKDYGATGLRFLAWMGGIFIALLPWILITQKYFGRALYTNASFYPLSPNWGEMQMLGPTPSVQNFFDQGTYLNSLNNMRALFRETKRIIGVLSFPELGGWGLRYSSLSLGFFSLVGLWAYRKRFEVLLLALAILGFYLQYLLGAFATGPTVFVRHLVPLFAPLIILASLGFLATGQRFARWLMSKTSERFTRRLVRGIVTVTILVGLRSFMITAENLRKDQKTFWSRESPDFERFGKWIDANLPQDSVLMIAMTPQDLSVASGRRVVVEPPIGPSVKTLELIKKYQVKYLVIDYSTEVYVRGGTPMGDLERYYSLYRAKIHYVDPTEKFVLLKLGVTD